MCWPGVPEAVNESIDDQIDRTLGTSGSSTRPAAVPAVVPVETAPAVSGGKHTLGGKCSVPYARSDQNSDLICSVDCNMTWRSESHPGVCY